jgi:hypothetical protein
VGLLTDGSAFARPDVLERVVHAVEQASHRRVLLLGAPASPQEATVKELAARLRKENRGLAGYDWREPQCASHADVLTAIHRDVDAVYHVSLAYTERSRPAREAERPAADGRPEALGAVLRAVRAVPAGTVREEALAGHVAVSIFAPESSRRVPVSVAASQLEPSALTPRVDVGTAVGAALAQLPVPPAPRWEAVARELVRAGCPFLALTIYEKRLEGGSGRDDVKKAALATVARSLGKRKTGRVPEPTAAKATPETPEDQEPRDEERSPEEAYSCKSLCSMHMVELCNNNRILWSSNHVRWEPTPCGARREEEFLKECYRQQWLAGTFDTACVSPCEGTTEGRERLTRILQGAGCLRPDPS